MRKRKRLYDKYKSTNNNGDFENYKKIQNKVTTEIRKAKKDQLEKLTEKLMSNNLSQKDWWRTSKYFIIPEQPASVPPLCINGIIYTDDKEKANLLISFYWLYINDIVENINSSTRLFADDTTLYIIVDNPVQAADQLNSALLKIH